MRYYVYIAQSLKDLGYYVGSTYTLERRLHEHNIGSTKSLRNRLPVTIIYTEEYLTKRDAQLRERQIKAYKGGEAFKKLISRRGTRVVNG